VIEVDEMRRAILPLKDFRTYGRLVRLLRELKPDVVHTHSSKAGIIGRWAADKVKAPVILHTVHGLAFTASTSRMVNSIYKALERQAAPLTTRIVCVADAMREQSLAANIGTPGQYVTVYSGMETGPFLAPASARDAVRESLGIRAEHVIVGTIARLFHLKGHEDLLNLAPALCAKRPAVRFLWVGDGLLRPHFERRIESMGLRDRFIMTGLVSPSRIPELANAMDILVHPSRREGLARALPQASLAGKPVVTYDVDGNREGVIDGRTGFVLPPFDTAQLGRAIDRLVADPALRRSMGESGRAFALGRFDAKVMVDALEALYTSLLPTGR